MNMKAFNLHSFLNWVNNLDKILKNSAFFPYKQAETQNHNKIFNFKYLIHYFYLLFKLNFNYSCFAVGEEKADNICDLC